MDSGDPGRAWRADGFAVLPGFLTGGELAPALAELGMMFPSADGFHDRTDPRYRRYLGDEFAGIDAFPFASTELSLLAVHDRLAGLAGMLLADDDIRIYSAEAWAKYTGAADYDQALHRDYLNHTVLVPTAAPAYQQLEMFVYLVDVPDELGPRTSCPGRGPPACRPSRTGTRARADPTARAASWPSRAARNCTRRRCPRPARPGPWSHGGPAPSTGAPR
jgi:hypothetical protein